ncbi:PEP-CTERM sorting domain-containing protein [Kiritimatiellota bacterium B12222]|nr:PEP-CTERM sorting domain-containing protein [Kiritimatiellota bacterium B12222]
MKNINVTAKLILCIFCGWAYSTAFATTSLWDGDPYSGSWSNTGGGSNSDGFGWVDPASPGIGDAVPNGIDDIAQWNSASYYGGGGSLFLSTTVGTGNPSAGGVLNVTLGRMELNTSGDNRGFTLLSPSAGTSTLTFDVSSGNAAVHNIAQTNKKNNGVIFDVNVHLNDSLDVYFNITDSEGPRDAITFNQLVSGSGAINKSGIGTMKLTGTAGVNTFSGGLNITNGEVIAEKSGALGTGNLIIQQSSDTSTAQLSIMDGISDSLSSSSTISLFSNSGNFATLNLGSGVNQSISGLFFDGVAQNTGSWGATGSGATFENDDWFVGEGVVTVIPEPSTMLLLGIGMGLMVCFRRK